MTNKRKQFSREFKLEAINMVINHNRKIAEVAESLNIGHSTLDRWLRQYRKELNGETPKAGNALTDEQRELQQLRKQVKRLTMERDILNEEELAKHCFAPTQGVA